MAAEAADVRFSKDNLFLNSGNLPEDGDEDAVPIEPYPPAASLSSRDDADTCPSVADCDLRWRLSFLVRPIPDDRIARFCNRSCAATISSVGEEVGGGDAFGVAGEMGGKLPPLGEGRKGPSEENPRLRRGSLRMPPTKLVLPPELVRVSGMGGGTPNDVAAAAAAASVDATKGNISSLP